MMPAETSRTSSYNPTIRLLDHLPDDRVDDAAALYLSALADKLVPVYGGGPQARRALMCGFNRHMCITAVENDRLVGILGIQSAAAGFMDVTVNTLRPFYGTFGSLWRIGFKAVQEQTVWPVGTLFGFRSSTVMVKSLI